MILEYMPGGSIKDRLGKDGAFTEITTRRYTRDILNGLGYLHSKNIIHHDIKGGNILLSSQDTAKLADFGISKELRSSTITTGGNSPGGTVRFMSPEVVRCGEGAPRFGRKSDVWSVGCVIVQMFTTEPPWKGYANQMQIMLAIGMRPPEFKLPETVSEEAMRFVQDCFIEEPDIRPTANELLCSGFLVEVQPDKEWHDRLLHMLSHMMTENEFEELKSSFCKTGEVSLEAVHTIDNSFRFFGLLESDKLISVGQYDALIKHLETMNLEECIRVISDYTEKIQDYGQMLTRQATKDRHVAPPSAGVNKRNKEGVTPLILAAKNNGVARVRSLIEAGADLDMKSEKGFIGVPVGWTALMLASMKGHTEVVADLTKAGANVDIQSELGYTALILAAKYGRKEVVAKLIESGADVNIRDEDGYTALIAAAMSGRKETVAKLIDSDADVNIKNKDGFTALILAAQNAHKEVVAKLIEAGADVNIRNVDGSAALILAAQYGHKEVVAKLIESRADVNIRKEDGFTALIQATLNDHKEVVAKLIEARADVNNRDTGGRSALDFAMLRENREIAEMLKSACALEDDKD